MRKSYVACAVLLVLSLVAGLWLSATINEPIDRVEVQLQVVEGDPSAADGLALMTIHRYENLFWKSRIALGAQPAILSDFRLDEDTSLHTGANSPHWLAQPLAEGDNWLHWDEEREQQLLLEDKEMYLETVLPDELCREIEAELGRTMGPHEEKTFEVWLKDYVDNYTDMVVAHRGMWYAEEVLASCYTDELIRRPVEEDFCVAVTLGTDGQGGVSYVDWNWGYYYEAYGDRAEGDTRPIPFGFDGVSVESQGMAKGSFVAVQMFREMAPLAQEDWFPRGYGIFYVPWSYEPFQNGSFYMNGEPVTGVDIPRFEEMTLVLPLDRTTGYVEAMGATPDGSSMWAVTREGAEVWLTGFADGGAVLYRQPLPGEMVDASGYVVHCREDFLVVCSGSGAFAVYTLAEDGAAQWQFNARNPYWDEEGWHGYWRSGFSGYRSYGEDLAYCDGKLAVCGGDELWVQVYDKTGLLCTVEYPLSLDSASGYGAGLRPYYYGGNDTPVQLFWQK